MKTLAKNKTIETVHEAVGIFDDADNLQAAIDDLLEHGFMRHEISVLADDKVIEKKLGHIYKRTEEAKDDPAAPRTVFVPMENIGEAQGTFIGIPLYIAAVTATGVVAASGGTLLSIIIAATAAGAAGMAIGTIFANLVSEHHAHYIEEQIARGGLLLWVHLRTPDMEKKARAALNRHAAYDVHVHEIPLHP